MSAKNVYLVLAVLLGYGLIIGGFVAFGQSLKQSVRVLDIIVSCLIFTQFTQFAIFPLIDRSNDAHKEAGMMGIHFTVLRIYCIAALCVMIGGIVCDVPFRYQLMGQLSLLLLLLLGRVATLHAGEKVERIYKKEEQCMEGKRSLQRIMDDLMEEVACAGALDPEAVGRLRSVHESLRFLTPSTDAEATELDFRFAQTARAIGALLKDPKLNGARIAEEVGRLTRILSKRKRY